MKRGIANMLWGNVRVKVGSDVKVKYDAADPTAGYLADKVVAGANIALSEGVGADENKLKIAVTGLHAVATSGNYSDLNGKPAIPPAQVNSDWNAVTGVAQILNKPAIPPAYNLPTASAGTLGGVKVGSGLSIDGSGVLSASVGASSYIGLSDTSDTAFTGKDKNVPLVNEANGNLDLTPTELATFFSLSDFGETDYTGKDGYVMYFDNAAGKIKLKAGGGTVPVKATGTELNTGTDDAKFATAKALKDGKFIGIHIGTTAPTDTTLLWLDTN